MAMKNVLCGSRSKAVARVSNNISFYEVGVRSQVVWVANQCLPLTYMAYQGQAGSRKFNE